MGFISEDVLMKYPPERTEVTIFNTKIVGTTFRTQDALKNGQEDPIEQIEDGDFIIIRQEIGNPYDEYACQIIHDKTGNHVGYLMKENTVGTQLSEEVWKNISNGDLYLGKITTTGGMNGKQRGFNLEVRRLHLKSEVDVAA